MSYFTLKLQLRDFLNVLNRKSISWGIAVNSGGPEKDE